MPTESRIQLRDVYLTSNRTFVLISLLATPVQQICKDILYEEITLFDKTFLLDSELIERKKKELKALYETILGAAVISVLGAFSTALPFSPPCIYLFSVSPPL